MPAAAPVPFNLAVKLGPAGALTVWTAVLLATYAGFIHVMWELLIWSTPTLIRGPWAVALCLGSVAQQAWEWGGLTMCWALPILYCFDAACQLGVKVAALQERLHAVERRDAQLIGKVQTLEGRLTYLEDRLRVAGEPRLVLANLHLLHAHLLHQE